MVQELVEYLIAGEVIGSPNFTNTIDFVTIASTGNAIRFW